MLKTNNNNNNDNNNMNEKNLYFNESVCIHFTFLSVVIQKYFLLSTSPYLKTKFSCQW